MYHRELREACFATGLLFLFAALVCVDLIFAVISAVRDAQGLDWDRWHISFENGYGERWQYLKWAAISVLCFLLTIRRQSWLYFAWSAIFLYLLLDDSLALHERVGWRLARYFGFQSAFGLRWQDFGELLTSALAGGPLLGFLAWSYWREQRLEPRSFAHTLILMLAALVFFGVGIDMVGIMLKQADEHTTLELIEDAGEMVVASLIVAYVASRAPIPGPS